MGPLGAVLSLYSYHKNKQRNNKNVYKRRFMQSVLKKKVFSAVIAMPVEHFLKKREQQKRTKSLIPIGTEINKFFQKQRIVFRKTICCLWLGENYYNLVQPFGYILTLFYPTNQRNCVPYPPDDRILMFDGWFMWELIQNILICIHGN